MRRTSFRKMHCPIARSLERVGEWWSILILRDALHGYRRFDEFRDSLGVAPNILTTRLAALVEAGMLEKRQYSAHPPRYEYVPTQAGRDFRPVLLSLMAFGNKHFAPEGAMVEVVDTRTGKVADIAAFDRATGEPIAAPNYAMVPGPAAPPRIRKRYTRRNVEAGAA
jgi:DNA-binding HxlR family transcriptional regulator